jgi:SAM-dependent methyltransferase
MKPASARRIVRLWRPRISIETLRVLYRGAVGIAGLVVDLDAVSGALLNSRILEYPYVIERLHGLKPGRALDVGATDTGNFLAPTLVAMGWEVWGIDVRPFRLDLAGFHLVVGDIRATSFADGFFDVAYCVSTIEHVGLSGRYGVQVEDPDGDLTAAREIRRIVRAGGRFILTIPYGIGGIVKPAERIYDKARLDRLTEVWEIVHRRFHHLDEEGYWHEVDEAQAARTRTPGGVTVALLELRRG